MFNLNLVVCFSLLAGVFAEFVQFSTNSVFSNSSGSFQALSYSPLTVSASSSACTKDSRNYVYGRGTCESSGSAFLRGKYIELGIHSCGSFGSYHKAPSSYVRSGNQLGLICDYNKNGFSGSPGYSGDYVLAGASLEGWTLQWTSSYTYTKINQGLLGKSDITPTYFAITSTDTTQSVHWIGSSGDLDIGFSLCLNNDDVFVVLCVTIKNNGQKTIKDLYYSRSIDPDQEKSYYGRFKTKNYVVYQPYSTDGCDSSLSTSYINDKYPESALVCAEGENDDFFLGLACINPHARVRHFGLTEHNPKNMYGGSCTTNSWRHYGGCNMRKKDYRSSKRDRQCDSDEAVHLGFQYDTLLPGEVVQFCFSYALNSDCLDDVFDYLNAVVITHPTYEVSGQSYVSCELNVTASSIDFYIFAVKPSVSNTAQWYLLGTSNVCYLDFNSAVFKDDSVQFKVVAHSYRDFVALKTAVIINAGTAITFVQSSTNCDFKFYMDKTTTVEVVKVGSYNPESVSFFLEYLTDSEVVSSLIQTDTSSPFTAKVSVASLIPYQRVSVKALGTKSGKVYSTSLCGVVYPKQIVCPTDITLTAQSVAENAAINTVVGYLGAVDTSTTTHTYTLLDDGAGQFKLSGNSILVKKALSYIVCSSQKIRVKVCNNDCCFEKDFVISITNVNHAPYNANPISFNVLESKSIGTIIGTITVQDIDAGDYSSFALLSSSSVFSIDSVTGAIRLLSALNFNLVKKYTLSIRATDHGSPPLSYDFTVTINVIEVNKAPTDISITYSGSSGDCDVLESVSVGTKIAQLSSTDSNAGDSFTYRVISCSNGLFTVTSDGKVKVQVAINTQYVSSSATLVVETKDAGGLTFQKTFTVRICSVLKNPVVSSHITCYCDENRPLGSTVQSGNHPVCQIEASSSDGTDLTYAIISDESINGNYLGAFSIDGCSGLLLIANSINYEVFKRYTFQVSVTSEKGASSTVTVEVIVVNINEVPIFNQVDVIYINENSAKGTIVISSLIPYVFDEDDIAADTCACHAFCCGKIFNIIGGNTNNAFTFSDKSTGKLTVLTTNLDYESVSSYELFVSVTDAGALYSISVISIIIVDLNEVPVCSSSSNSAIFATINEYSSVGTKVSQGFNAIDPDNGQALTYAIASGNSGNAFELTSDSVDGVTLYYFTVAASGSCCYFGITPEYNLVVSVTDNGSPQLSTSCSLKVKVNDEPETPTITSSYDFYIEENSPKQTYIGHALYSDYSDHSGRYTVKYVITNYGGDANKKFAILSDIGQLYLNSDVLRYMWTPEFTYVVSIVSSSGITITTTVRIHVIKVEYAPEFGNCPIGQISENLVDYDFVSSDGQPLTYYGADENEDVLSFKVVTVNEVYEKYKWMFEVVNVKNNTFQLQSKWVFNYEWIDTYVVKFSVSDGMFHVNTSCIVTVVDVNDAPHIEPEIVCYIDSGVSVGSTICSFLASDEDNPNNENGWGSLTWNIVSIANGVSFTSDDKTGSIILTSTLASLGWYSGMTITALTVTVVDGGSLSSTTVVKVVVISSSHPPLCPANQQVFGVNENSPTGTFIGNLVGTTIANDITHIDNDMECFIIGGNPKHQFHILPEEACPLVTTINSTDFETKSNYSLLIMARNKADQAVVYCTVLVYINDLNETSTCWDQEFLVDENIVAGPITVGGVEQPVYNVTRSEGNYPGIFTLTCFDSSCANAFEIDGLTGVISLKAGRSLNYETRDTYTYRVSYTDEIGTCSSKVTLKVQDVNEAPVMYCNDFTTLESIGQSQIGPINVVDLDFESTVDFSSHYCGDSCGLTYSILSSTTTSISIGPSTGLLFVSDCGIDYEYWDSYSLVIQVQDSGGLAATCEIAIQLTDDKDCEITSIVIDSSNSLDNIPTSGGDEIVIYGRNFGPTEHFLEDKGLSLSDFIITANFQTENSAELSEYVYSVNCALSSGNTLLICAVPPGVGANLGMVVTVASSYPSIATCLTPLFGQITYAPPTITAVECNFISTQEETTVIIIGTNFGPKNSTYNHPVAIYGNSHFSSTIICEVIEDHVKLECKTTGCFGGSVEWKVVVGGQSSNVVTQGSCSSSVISSIEASLLATCGGDTFTIIGSNFGDEINNIVVSYGHTGTEYIATCILVQNHQQLQCTSVPGIGQNLTVIVTILGVQSNNFINGLSYHKPLLTEIFGPGLLSPTYGGAIIYLSGNHFGPLTTSPSEIVVTYGKTGEEFVAINCMIIAPHVKISCTTAPGTGKNHIWRVQIDGILSNTIGYSAYMPPAIYYYTGTGCESSSDGYETVYIYGANFGYGVETLDEVFYIGFNNSKFIVTENCTMFTPHEVLKCLTLPGAGSQLEWTVIVDGQSSTAPTTSYLTPYITSIYGPGAQNASVLGGEIVYLEGGNFGPPNCFELYGVIFLESVTYGHAATEYTAQDCVVLSPSLIECKTAPGIGENLIWQVKIAGQLSHPSEATTSYASPRILSISPTVGLTDGSTVITITGTNFATSYGPVVIFNGITLQSITIIDESTISFNLPAQVNVTSILYPVYLSVGQQSSNVKYCKYADPYITSVNAFVGVDGLTYLSLIGTSFSVKPTVTITSGSVSTIATCPVVSHTEVVCKISVRYGYAKISTPVATSNTVSFLIGEPVILASQLINGSPLTSGYTQSNQALLRIVGQLFGFTSSEFYIYIENRESLVKAECVMTSFTYISKTENASAWNALAAEVPNEDCNLDFQEVICKLPEGEGKRNSIKVNRGGSRSIGCGCNLCQDCSCFSYNVPVIHSIKTPYAFTECISTLCDASNYNSITCQSHFSKGPTVGNYTISLSGKNFGVNPVVTVNGKTWSVVKHLSNHTFVVATVPVGDGIFKIVTLSAGNQNNLYGANTQSSSDDNYCYFSYNPPQINSHISTLSYGCAGSVSPITVTGSNFGISVPIVTLGTIPITVLSHTQTSITFVIPPGQGKNLRLTVTVNGQQGQSPDTYTYQPPVLTNVKSYKEDDDYDNNHHGCSTSGGRDSKVYLKLTGANFGVIDQQWSIKLGNVVVTRDDIISYSCSEIKFYPPPGQGKNLLISLTVGNQQASGGPFYFDYSKPSVSTCNIPPRVNTCGGDRIRIFGYSFGRSCRIYVYDPRCHLQGDYSHFPRALLDIEPFEYTPDDDDIYRMTPTPVSILTQNDSYVEFVMPPGAGSDLLLYIDVAGQATTTNISYSAPEVNYYQLADGGSALGGETLRIYGNNFGNIPTPISVVVDGEPCLKPHLVNVQVNSSTAYIECTTPKTTVGDHVVNVTVAFQSVTPELPLNLQCKKGSFGGENEECTVCETGYSCPDNGMYTPQSSYGFFVLSEPVPSPYCSAESQVLRTHCPASLPCIPADSCPGNNTCSTGYSGERCADCDDGFYRINGLCQTCPDSPWVLVFFVVLAATLFGYVAYKLSQKNVNMGILAIGVDYLQVLAVFGTVHVKWPQSLVNMYNGFSLFNINVEVFAPGCWDSLAFSFKEKWIAVTVSPLFVIGLFLVLYAAHVGLIKYVEGKKLYSAADAFYKFFAVYLIMFYYGYLLLSNNTLAVFNCQPAVPVSDGHKYMVAVGPNGGVCYEEGSLQQALEPWAILAFIFYIVGFPAYVGYILYTNRDKITFSQVMRAAGIDMGKNERQELIRFKSVYYKLYFQFKPQYFYWVFLILLRKMALSVSAIIFRENIVFLVSVYILVLFASYTIQVRYNPYMCPADYDDVVTDNAYLVSGFKEIVENSARRVRIRQKKARLGNSGPLIDSLTPKVSFFNNYNTVESTLLFSAIMICISAIMFESEQLSEGQRTVLAGIDIFIVTISLLYFAWVLFTEVWIAFYPDQPLPYLGIYTEDVDSAPTSPSMKVLGDDDDFSGVDSPAFEHANPMMTKDNSAVLRVIEEDEAEQKEKERAQKAAKADMMVETLQAENAQLKKLARGGAIALPNKKTTKPKFKRGFSSFEDEDEGENL